MNVGVISAQLILLSLNFTSSETYDIIKPAALKSDTVEKERFMKLSLKKYLTTALEFLAGYVFLEILICILYFAGEGKDFSFIFTNIANFAFLLSPGAYHLTMFFVFKKKSEKATPEDAVITTWESSFRYHGKVIVKKDDTEYASPSYFSHVECKDLVGKTISCAIIYDTLFIYCVKD